MEGVLCLEGVCVEGVYVCKLVEGVCVCKVWCVCKLVEGVCV